MVQGIWALRKKSRKVINNSDYLPHVSRDIINVLLRILIGVIARRKEDLIYLKIYQ